jgi:ribose transport system permease protein
MTSVTISSQPEKTNFLTRLLGVLKKIPPVYPTFLVIYIVVGALNENYTTFDGIFQFLRRSSPTAILAIGQMFVLASGGFDLSVGSLISLVLFGSSIVISNDPANAAKSIAIVLGIGVLVGLVNGITVSYLRVPSFIVTLGMLLLLRGMALYWVGGAPKGYFTDNWRMFGRGYIEDVPIVGRFPIALIILIVIFIISYYLFHKSNLGKQILAIGDNARASHLSGVKVHLVRVVAFVFSSVLAVIAGILIGGAGGISQTAGVGLEMQAVSAAVIGGTMLLGGKGSVPNAIFGAFTLEALFNLLNLLGLPKPYKDAVQGIIIIGAVAYAAISTRRKR